MGEERGREWHGRGEGEGVTHGRGGRIDRRGRRGGGEREVG